MGVAETIGLGILAYWAGTGIASGGLQLGRGIVLAAGAVAEGNPQLAGHALARSLAAPALGVVQEGMALTGDVYCSVLSIGRAAAPLLPGRNGL